MFRLGWFVAGVALGAVGSSLVKGRNSEDEDAAKGKGREALKGLVAAYDHVAERVARTREDLEDLVAEVRHEKAQEQGEGEDAPPGVEA